MSIEAPPPKFSGEEDLSPEEIEERIRSIRVNQATADELASKKGGLSMFSEADLDGDAFLNVAEDELCYNYEYCMVFKMQGPNGEAWKEGLERRVPDYALSIIKALLEAEMTVYPYLSAQKDELLVLITVEDNVLNEFADDKNYLVELDSAVVQHKMEAGSTKNKWKGRLIEDPDNEHSVWSPYKHIWGKWESEHDDVSIYKGLQRTGPRKHDISIFKKGSLHRFKLIAMMIQADPHLMKGAGIPLLTLMHKSHIDAFYPLHQPTQAQAILSQTRRIFAFPWRQNFKQLKEYFGEKSALYFVFIGHYSAWLVVPAIISCGFQLVVWSNGPNYSHPVIPIFGAFICLWGVVMLEYWKRTEGLYAFVWGMSDFESQEMQRPEYKGKLMKSFIDGRYMLYYPDNAYRNKMALSTSVIVTLIFMVIGAVAGIYVMKFVLTKSIGSTASTVASVVNTVQITVFNMLYTNVARKLVENENHKTDTLFQDSLIMKMFLFQFVNSYASFFFIAFIAANLPSDVGTDPTFLGQCGASNCMAPLALNLAIIFGTRLTITNITDILSQYYAHRSKVAENVAGLTDEEKTNLSPPEHDYALQEFDPMMDSIVTYADATIQYGFSMLFICALPIACACSLVSNHVKVKLQAWKMLTMFQRPIPQGAQDIGSWHTIFTIITVLAVMTNAGLICFTMDILWKDSDEIGGVTSPDGTHRAGFTLTGRLWIFIGFIVTLLMTQFFLADYIDDETEEVSIQKQRQDHIRSKIIDGVADDDYDEVEAEPNTDLAKKEKGCCGCAAQQYVSLGAQLKGLDFDALRPVITYSEGYRPLDNQLTTESGKNREVKATLTRHTLLNAGFKLRESAIPNDDEPEEEVVEDSNRVYVCSVCSIKSPNKDDFIPASAAAKKAHLPPSPNSSRPSLPPTPY